MTTFPPDHQLTQLIAAETLRQQETIQLIPSENYASLAVMAAVGSPFMNKYSEGYAKRRYYEGNEVVDELEQLAIDRAKKLFGVPHVNVQPYSGSPANAAIQMALMQPGDTLMGLKLSGGGHLTHGHPQVTFSGTFYKTVQYGLDSQAKIDLGVVRQLARQHKPRVIYVGTTAYPFEIDFAAFAKIADEVGAWLVADISHIAGLVAGQQHPSPVPHAHVVMTTTHKTLRGPRGAMILVTQKGLDRDPDLAAKIDKAVFPGVQGGPHNNTTAGIAVALHEAAQPQFLEYAQQIKINASALANELKNQGLKLVGDGTQTHLLLIDLSSWGGGTQLAYAMAQAGLYANKNTVPNEPLSPFYPSGVRLGSPAMTTRGMTEPEMEQIAIWIAEIEKLASQFVIRPSFTKEEKRQVIKEAKAWAQKERRLKQIRQEVKELCDEFPIY